jgi:hypothetical protein
MKDAFGGIVNFVFLAVFLLVVIGLLGLVVSYTKAFRMKDAIISVIEEYEGTGCYPESPLSPSGTTTHSACREKIRQKAASLAYNPPALSCTGTNVYMADGLYCYTIEKKASDAAVISVITQVDMSFPIIEKIMGFRFFQVKGDTRTLALQS